LGGGSGFPIVVTLGSFAWEGMLEVGVSCQVTADSTVRRAVLPGGLGVFALVRRACLANLMTAPAIRVAVSVRLAYPEGAGAFRLAGAVRFLSMSARHFANALGRVA
jgi:hypothetical protein